MSALVEEATAMLAQAQVSDEKDNFAAPKAAFQATEEPAELEKILLGIRDGVLSGSVTCQKEEVAALAREKKKIAPAAWTAEVKVAFAKVMKGFKEVEARKNVIADEADSSGGQAHPLNPFSANPFPFPQANGDDGEGVEWKDKASDEWTQMYGAWTRPPPHPKSYQMPQL